MKAVGYPNLKLAYDMLSQHNELDAATGSIDPQQPIVICQEESESRLIQKTMWETPIVLSNKDYALDHGIFVCGHTFTMWLHDGEVRVRREGYSWSGRDVLTVNCYNAVKEILSSAS